MRWALHTGLQLLGELKAHESRLNSRLQEALLVRAGDSEWAQHDAGALQGLASGVKRRVVALQQAETMLRNAAGRRIAPSDREPFPFPRQPSWLRLKRLARELSHPETMLGTVLNQLLTDPIALADVPFLYQRWCGLQLLRAFEHQGWSRRGDLVGALFLGGRVEFFMPDAAGITVWIEPRISKATMAVTGWGVAPGKAELTPDFLITCGPAGMRDAFVLDATMARSDEVLASKAKYRQDIVGLDTQFVAGVPVQRRPLRAWAIAPLRGSHCRLSDSEGRTGGVPLHPGERDFQGLYDWVADVSLHARRQAVGSDLHAA